MKKPLKIAILSYRSAPFGGGQGVYVYELSKALNSIGHNVDVISGPPYPELIADIELIKLPGLKPDEDGYCCLSFDDKITVHIQLDKETENLTFFAELGRVNETRKAEIFGRLLEAN